MNSGKCQVDRKVPFRTKMVIWCASLLQPGEPVLPWNAQMCGSPLIPPPPGAKGELDSAVLATAVSVDSDVFLVST